MFSTLEHLSALQVSASVVGFVSCRYIQSYTSVNSIQDNPLCDWQRHLQPLLPSAGKLSRSKACGCFAIMVHEGLVSSQMAATALADLEGLEESIIQMYRVCTQSTVGIRAESSFLS